MGYESQVSLLDGAIDDPDGPGPVLRPSPDGARGTASSEAGYDLELDEDDTPAEGDDLELEITPVDATELEEVPDDAPGPDSARW